MVVRSESEAFRQQFVQVGVLSRDPSATSIKAGEYILAEPARIRLVLQLVLAVQAMMKQLEVLM